MEQSAISTISAHYQTLKTLYSHLNRRIVGQKKLIIRLLTALICDGHLLVEGAPGLAKTTAIKELANCIEGAFHRIQFTPDLLPADLTGTEIFRPQEGSFVFQNGPLFHNLILADEINRAPAKVQSALLEAMAERQITIGRKTYLLPALFLVMATQNPIEQEGTYPLPEAQLDRFLMYVKVDYPSAKAEQKILQLNHQQTLHQSRATQQSSIPKISEATIQQIRRDVLNIHISPSLEEYIVQLVLATRDARHYGDDLAKWLRFGASPRGTIGLARCARAQALLQDRDYVTPSDIHAIAEDVLCHRILLTFEAEAEGITAEYIIKEILQRVAVP